MNICYNDKRAQQVLDVILNAQRPMTAREVGDVIGVSRDVARIHLKYLVDAGMLYSRLETLEERRNSGKTGGYQFLFWRESDIPFTSRSVRESSVPSATKKKKIPPIGYSKVLDAIAVLSHEVATLRGVVSGMTSEFHALRTTLQNQELAPKNNDDLDEEALVNMLLQSNVKMSVPSIAASLPPMTVNTAYVLTRHAAARGKIQSDKIGNSVVYWAKEP